MRKVKLFSFSSDHTRMCPACLHVPREARPCFSCLVVSLRIRLIEIITLTVSEYCGYMVCRITVTVEILL